MTGLAGTSTTTQPTAIARVAGQAASAPSPLPRDRTARASRGAARTALPTKVVSREVATGPSFAGDASWYGGSFQGQRTANGERFDTGDLTAASKTLPFGTHVRVCRPGTCVVVRINDRGPYVSGRVLDLSRAAAQALGYSGVAAVTATPIAQRDVTIIDDAALARQRLRARQVLAAQVISASLRGTPSLDSPVAPAMHRRSLPAPATVPSGAAVGMLLTGAGALRRTRKG